jgi:hypothetical protein
MNPDVTETSAILYKTTRRYNLEDSHLQTHRHENLNSYVPYRCLVKSRTPVFVYGHPELECAGHVQWKYSFEHDPDVSFFHES